MSKKYLIATFMLLIVTLISFNVSPCQLSIHVTTAPIQQLSPAQLDFENFQSSVLLFTININYPGQHRVKLVNNQIFATLKNGITVTMLEGAGFNSDAFDVKDQKSITNFMLGKAGNIKMHDFKITNEARKKIIEPALATGKFPAGIYRFEINAVDDSNNAVQGDDNPELILENPSQIELRLPRDGEITNEFPIFEWTYDGQEVELTINEKPPTMSGEEAISRLPYVFQNKFTSTNSFQYPPGGVRPLQKGKTYVWRVVGKVKAAGGDQSVESPLAQFKVEDDLQIIKHSELLDRLEKILGGNWKKVSDKFKDLDAAGNFYLDKKPLSNTELEEILNFLELNSGNIEKVTLE
jgi:hypothetical protein